MTYRYDTPCLTDRCNGTPFIGPDTESPGYCDACHVARMEERAEAEVTEADADLACALCGDPVRLEVERFAAYYVSLTDGDSLSYSPTLHDHGPATVPAAHQRAKAAADRRCRAASRI